MVKYDGYGVKIDFTEVDKGIDNRIFDKKALEKMQQDLSKLIEKVNERLCKWEKEDEEQGENHLYLLFDFTGGSIGDVNVCDTEEEATEEAETWISESEDPDVELRIAKVFRKITKGKPIITDIK